MSVGESIITLGMTVFPSVAGEIITFAQSAVGFGDAARWTLFGLAVGGIALSVAALPVAHPFESL